MARAVLIAIEGVDGAGKRTLTERSARGVRRRPASRWPRWRSRATGDRCTADLAAEALHGEHGDLAASVYAMAMLFALDRAGAVATRSSCLGATTTW